MIAIFTGTPGSGKSLHCAKQIRDNLIMGKKLVVSNMEIATEKLKHMRGQYIFLDNPEITPERLIKISQDYSEGYIAKESSIKLYIDEAQLLFNSRDWSRSDRMEWIRFFTQHRKLGYDVYLITQNDRMLDRQIRSLAQYEFKHRKLWNYGWKGKLVSFWCGGRLYMYAWRFYELKNNDAKIGSTYFLCRKKYYEIYDTLRQW